ncbi:MAG: aminomethyl-transferring glycine dehydrogenase subunit GcvPA [Methylocystaceae bacterium]
MSYIPNTQTERQDMLETIGLNNMANLFADIPSDVKLRNPLNLGLPQSEFEIRERLLELANKNLNLEMYPSFMGGGAYNHFVPALVDQLLLRSEFYTSYTPYQPEISQGILQAIYEWQTYVCMLTGMDVANASMYDGASALAEACLMAAAITKKRKIIIPDNLNPAYIQVINTYLKGQKIEVITVSAAEGILNLGSLTGLVDNAAAVVLQYPNYFGILEPDLPAIEAQIHAAGGLLIMSTDPIALGLLKSPATWGADLVAGEGQSLGLPLNYGGPYLGFLATREKYTRFLPGRLVGQTLDSDGAVGYVLTLQAREQHIRRDKAGSNICSNQALCALAATIYLAAIGKDGFRAIARRCHQLAAYALMQLEQVGLTLKYQQPFYREFVLKVSNPREVNARLLKEGIVGGIELEDGLLLAFTEMVNCAQIDRLVAVMGGVK